MHTLHCVYTTPDAHSPLTANVHGVYKRPAMHLSDYMTEKGLSDEVVGVAIARSRASVSRYRRKLVTPDWDAIEAIRAFTKGRVTAEDWRHQAASSRRRRSVRAA
jgi:hypothetical protein